MVNQSLVLRINICGKNPHLRQAAETLAAILIDNNKMINKIILFITISVLLSACTVSQKTGKLTSASYDSTISLTQVETPINNEDGPPFTDTCLCSFDYIGKIRTGTKRFDLILAGKGWNPSFYSCSWTWGELIYNEFPPDSMVTDFRIHLVDIDKLDKNTDSTFLTTEQFNENLIATYSKTGNNEYMTVKFDPNKTGKYPKPKQWTEE